MSTKPFLYQRKQFTHRRKGLTGTPKYDGKYWCEFDPPPGETLLRLSGCQIYEEGRWHSLGPFAAEIPTRYHRLPGQLYTESKA